MDRWRRTRSRTADPVTSKAAVEPVTEASLNARQEAVLTALKFMDGRAADHELLEWYAEQHIKNPEVFPRQSPSGLRTRRSELVAMGKVADIGLRAHTPSGREAIVWSIVVTP
jgi:hypothetical protein